MTAHFVHESEDGDYAVVGVFFDSGDNPENPGEASLLIGTLWDVKDDPSATVNENLHSLIDPTSGFYHYSGSFTTPPCTEGVLWFVQARPVSVTRQLIEDMIEHLGGHPGTARPTQPINGREIGYNVK
mmetsp:Transcript_11291/g.26527  ORF Transcript_11291/g.26527 Transcript_11291/m.26527 type:complete len:128 (-) Transcript_11291:136-519(-)